MKSYKVSEWDLLILEESKAHKIKRAKISSKIITKK